MRKKQFYLLCTFMVIGCANAQFSAAQVRQNDTATPFSLLLGDTQTESQNAGRSKAVANTNRRIPINSIDGRRLKAGMNGYEYKDTQGGRVMFEGLGDVEAGDADQLIYQIPSNSDRAQNLIAQFEAQYGSPDVRKADEQIWYIKNPNIQRGQAKIITLRVTDAAGTLTINADRMPITRRGELLVKPQRRLPRQNLQNQNQKNNASPATIQPKVEDDPT